MSIHERFPFPASLKVAKYKYGEKPSDDTLLASPTAVIQELTLNNHKLLFIIDNGTITSMMFQGYNAAHILGQFEDMMYSIENAAQEHGISIDKENLKIKFNPLYNSIDEIFACFLSYVEKFETEIGNSETFAQALCKMIHNIIAFPFGVTHLFGSIEYHEACHSFLQSLNKKVQNYNANFNGIEGEYCKRSYLDIFHSLVWHFTPDSEQILRYELFGIEDISGLSSNELFLRLKESYINIQASDKLSQEMWMNSLRSYGRRVGDTDRSKGADFFLGYNETSGSIHIGEAYSKVGLEDIENIDELLEKLAEYHTQGYLEDIRRTSTKSVEVQGIHFTSTCIHYVSNKNGFLDYSPQEQHELTYGFIRYFIMERGLRLPHTFYSSGEDLHFLFSEHPEKPLPEVEDNTDVQASIDYIEQFGKRLFGRRAPEEIPDGYNSPIKFLLYIIKNDRRRDLDFSLSNHLIMYIGKYKNEFSKDDIIELLHTISECKGSWFFYFLLTEYGDISYDLLTIVFGKTQDLSIAEIYEKNKKPIKDPRVIKIFEALGDHFMSLNKNLYGNLGFIIYFLIKHKGASQIHTLEDFCDAIIEFLIEDGYKFAYENGVLIFSNRFENENALIVSQIKSQVEMLISGNARERMNLLHTGEFFPKLGEFIGRILTVSQSNTENLEDLQTIFRELSSSNIVLDTEKDGTMKISAPGNPQKLIAHRKLEDEIKPLIVSSMHQAEHLEKQFEAFVIPGAYPVGGKVHFSNPLEPMHVSTVQEISGITSTPFKLLREDNSMCLPPCNSPAELMNIMYEFMKIGVLNKDNLEGQASIYPRLPNRLCGILGSTMLFLKNYQVTYDESAFVTTHEDKTQRCIMCYDDGFLERKGFPQMPEGFDGRTDMLGLKRIEEFINYYIVGNFVSHSFTGDTLESIGSEFIRKYEALLKKYGIQHILDAKWVHDPQEPEGNNDDYAKHASVVNTCTDIRNNDIHHANTTGQFVGLSFEVRRLLEDLVGRNNLLPGMLQIEKH